ncbi:hypothetical protein M426DRAFT_14629 [Hypoxylon sp. CI-4A]|nr:hypothetical protein M426DRAFT_14629 [Hypoxylon sp. CI-4A]
MHTTNIFALALALCSSTVLAVPAAAASVSITRIPKPPPSAVDVFDAFNTPNCASLQDYCKCQNDDFDCETNPSCEWCRDHDAWSSSSQPPAPTTT